MEVGWWEADLLGCKWKWGYPPAAALVRSENISSPDKNDSIKKMYGCMSMATKVIDSPMRKISDIITEVFTLRIQCRDTGNPAICPGIQYGRLIAEMRMKSSRSKVLSPIKARRNWVTQYFLSGDESTRTDTRLESILGHPPTTPGMFDIQGEGQSMCHQLS